MKVEVYEVIKGRANPHAVATFEVTGRTVSEAKKLAREELEKKYRVRALGPKSTGGLISYVTEKTTPEEKKRGKPVRHDGPIGQGRKVQRSRSKGKRGKR